MPAPDLRSRLEDVLDGIGHVERFTRNKTAEDYAAEPMLRLAVERCVEIVSEASRHIPDEFKAFHPEIPWRKVADIGNVLRHGYHAVDDRVIWGVTRNDLPLLKIAVADILREIERREGG